MVENEVTSHCTEIDRCNQRGGRMLSIVDLIEAGTMTKDLAAYSLAAISNGASFMVGANPGGAGKTTVMGALLNFVPADVTVLATGKIAVIERGLSNPEPRCCYICHEIGSGPYYAYLWGSALRKYFDLPLAGHMIATNLHADTYTEAYQQVCGDNGVSQPAFRRMNLILFLLVNRNGRHRSRKIAEVWESDGIFEHQQVLQCDNSVPLGEASKVVSPGDFVTARENIDKIVASGARTMEQVRSVVLQIGAIGH